MQSQPISDCTTDLLEAAHISLMDCLEDTMRAFDLDCELSLRRHAGEADNLVAMLSDCRIGEAEHIALILECLAEYVRIKSYTTGDYAGIVPGLLKTVIEANLRP